MTRPLRCCGVRPSNRDETMSYILEALRKSEQDRQRGTVPTLVYVQNPAVDNAPFPWRWLLLVLVLATALVSVSVLLWLRGADVSAQQQSRATANAPVEQRQTALLPVDAASPDGKPSMAASQRAEALAMPSTRWTEQYYRRSSARAHTAVPESYAEPLKDPLPAQVSADLDLSEREPSPFTPGHIGRETQSRLEIKPAPPSLMTPPAQRLAQQGALLPTPDPTMRTFVADPFTSRTKASEWLLTGQPRTQANGNDAVLQPPIIKITDPEPPFIAAQQPRQLTMPDHALPLAAGSSHRNQMPQRLTLPDHALSLAAGSSLRNQAEPVPEDSSIPLPVNALQPVAGSSVGDLTPSTREAVAPQIALLDTAIEPRAPLLLEFPATFRHSVPPIKMDVHAYHQQDSERYVAVDLKRYVEGDEIADGMRLESITSGGIIVLYSGKRFSLKRP